MSVPDRLKSIRDLLGKTQKEMASLIGISYRTWQNYEDGVNSPGWDACGALVKLGFNANWLLTGSGDMKCKSIAELLLDEKFNIASDREIKRNSIKYSLNGQPRADDTMAVPNEGFVQIPRYEVSASAGGGSLIHSEQIVDHLTFRADWVRNALGVSPSSLALINVKGDSMEPTLANGDVILIDMTLNGFDDNAVYVLRLNGTLLVKRVKRNFDGSVLVSSDNTMYPPDTIKNDVIDTLNVVGRVVWCGRRM